MILRTFIWVIAFSLLGAGLTGHSRYDRVNGVAVYRSDPRVIPYTFTGAAAGLLISYLQGVWQTRKRKGV